MKMIKIGIIVGININNKNNFDESMEELKNLCLACKIETVGQIKQNSKKVNSTFYMGSGKIDELKNLLFHNNEAKAATSSPDFKAGITLSITSDKHMRVKK